MIDASTTIYTQYLHSPKLRAIVDGINKLIDPRDFTLEFLEKVWTLSTANTWGLDNWGRIIGLGRNFTTPDGETYTLDDDQYRKFLYIKAAANITDCSIPSLNRLLQAVFEGRGGVPYIIEVDTMYIRYVFPFWLEDWERVLLRSVEIIPKPAGVGFEIFEYDPAFTFGFYVDEVADLDQPWRPFNQGTFGVTNFEF